MKKTRKPVALLLSVLMLLALFAPLGVVSLAADDETPEDDIVTVVETGDCGAEGSDVRYTLYSDGTLVIEGKGEIRAHVFERRSHINSVFIKRIIIKEGITKIGSNAFASASVGTLVLPDSLKTIGACAFYNNSINAIQFGNGVETMELGAFDFCFSNEGTQETLIFPESLKTIGEDVFDYCDNLRTVVFGSQVESLGESAFDASYDLENLVFLNGNTEWTYHDFDFIQNKQTVYSYAGGIAQANAALRGSAFVDLATVEETDHDWDEGTVTKLPTCTEAGEMTYLCKTNPSHRKTETIPATGKHVYKETIKPTAYCKDGSRTLTCIYCGDVKTETLPAPFMHTYDNGVITTEPTYTENGMKTFTCIYCGATYTETVPAIAAVRSGQIGPDVYYTVYENGHADIYGTGDTYAGFYANHTTFFGFSLPVEITSLEVQPGVTGLLSEFGFSHLLKLQSVKLPSSLTSINYAMFHFCLSLESIDVDPENPAYTTVDGVLYNKSVTELVHYPLGKKDKTYTVPAGVKRIEQRAFEAVRNLEEIILPDTLETIGFGAFMGAPDLNTVHLGNGVVTIDDYAFYRVDHVPTITIPGTVKYIGEWAFGYRPYFTDVYYPCPKEAWDKIEFGSENEPLLDATLHFGEHAWDDGVITTPATCGKDGVRTFTCQNCGDTYTETISATGAHNYQSVVTTAATCETDGVKTFTCTVCGGSYTETLAATGHNWSEWIVTRNPSETREGEAYRFCKNDPTHIEHKTLEKLPKTSEDNLSFGERVRAWLQSIFDRIGEAFRMLFSW